MMPKENNDLAILAQGLEEQGEHRRKMMRYFKKHLSVLKKKGIVLSANAKKVASLHEEYSSILHLMGRQCKNKKEVKAEIKALKSRIKKINKIVPDKIAHKKEI